jgi:hypothetical protein
MSSIVVVNAGENAFLVLITNVDMTLRLYQNNVTSGLTEAQIEALVVSAFTEATFAGYAAVSMATAWTTTAGNPSEATRPQVTFTRTSTGAVQNVFGYYVTRNSDGVLMWFEHFDAAIPVEINGDAVIVTPRLTLDDDTGRNRVDSQIFTASGTYTKPAGLKAVMVRLVGGGGAGGGTAATGASSGSEAGGGGGGGYSEKVILADDLGTTETVTIGAGGTAAVAGNNAGGTGGTTSFGSHLQATGGGGGLGGAAAAGAPTAASPGAGGVGSGGDVNAPGSDGWAGYTEYTGTVASPVRNTTGGASQLGPPAPSPNAAGSGRAGENYGGGSCGALASANNAARASLVGAPGIVIVTEYF